MTLVKLRNESAVFTKTIKKIMEERNCSRKEAILHYTNKKKEKSCIRTDGLEYDDHSLRWNRKKQAWFCWWCDKIFVQKTKGITNHV